MSKLKEIVPPLYIRVDKELKEKIEAAAKKTYMSVSAYVRMVVNQHIITTEREDRS